MYQLLLKLFIKTEGFYKEQHISKCDNDELRPKKKEVILNIFLSCGEKRV